MSQHLPGQGELQPYPSASKLCHPSLKLSEMSADAVSLMGDSVFCYTKDNDKPAPSMEDLAFLKMMEREIHQDA